MKIIHTADIHLGGRRTEDIFAQLKKIIDLIQKEKVEVLIIAGDLFDREMSATSTIRDRVKNLFSQIPQTEIFILPGNHDQEEPYRDEFYYGPNVEVLKKRPMEVKKIGNVEIYFFPFYDQGSSQEMVKSAIANPSQAEFKIGVVHGTYMENKEIRDHLLFQNEGYYPIFSSDLREMNLDYLALGHFHYHRLWQDGETWCGYPGTIEILSFKELDERKVIMLEIKDKVSPYPINIGMQKKVGSVTLDIQEIDKLKEIRKNYDILKVTVKGIVKNEKETAKKLIQLEKEYSFYQLENQTKSFASIEETKLGQMIKERIEEKIKLEPEKKEFWKDVLMAGFEILESGMSRK
ncbi:MAG: exonuclease SbcCD subunit D [Candidatus Aminicenantia bacterium]